MKRTLASLVLVTVVSMAAIGCAFERSTQVNAPTTPAGPSGGGTTGSSTSLVGGWVSSAVPTLPSPSSCGNFQYQIATQTATTISGTFTASCGGMLVSASANGTLINSNTVTITINGSGALPGIPSCTFSVTGNGSVEENGNALRIPYSGTTCLGPVQGTETLRRPQPASQPAPAPAPAPAPPPPLPPAPSGPSDAIDLHGAVITGGSPRDVADWPITTAITSMDFSGNGVRVDFSKKDGPGRWPDVVPPGWDGSLQYTLWMVVYINGQWYTSGGAEYWYGLDRQGGPPNEFAYNWYYSPIFWGPLGNHQPANGERVGFFVTSGDQRAKDVRAITERSNVVELPFPSGGGYFTFSLFKSMTR